MRIEPKFLTSSERAELMSCVRRHREDHGVARRANAILLLDEGKSCQLIAEFLYLDDDTVRLWYKAYREGGWDFLSTDGWKGGQSRMTSAQEAELSAWLEDRFCRSTTEVRAHISATYGLEYSHSGCIKLLARLGFEYRKPKGLPRVAPAAAQAAFIEMYQRLLNALEADEAIYFADAVHPEYQTKPAYGWVKAGSNPAVQTTAGRGRVNIHGALNLETFDLSFVEPITVDGISAVQLLAKIEASNPYKRLIHVIWDNAAYHKGQEVRDFLARPDCRIHLIPLPPYCPHLNPIERLWAVMHRCVTHNQYYPTQKQFADAILAFFRKTLPNEWRSFRDTISDNFRVISHDNFRVFA